MVGQLRYGSGLPFYRLEQWQRSLGVPLAASTQWELAEAVARVAQPAWDHLALVAAQAPNVFNDDTTMRVGALRRQIRAEPKPERTGIFTTGIVASAQDHPIALFFTGRQQRRRESRSSVAAAAGGFAPAAADVRWPLRATSPKTSKPSWGVAWPTDAARLSKRSRTFPRSAVTYWRVCEPFTGSTPKPNPTA